MCIHVPSGTALPGPAGGGPRATPGTQSRHARVSTDAAAAAAAAAAASACGGGGVVGEEGRADSAAEKGFAEVLAKNPNRNT